MTLNRAAALLALAGAALIVAGVAVLGGPAWASLTAGFMCLAGSMLLYDPEDRGHGPGRREGP